MKTPRSLEGARTGKSESAALRRGLLALCSHVPCVSNPPADPAERRKWAIAGLAKLYQWFPFRDEDGSRVNRLAPYQIASWADRWETVHDNAPDGLPRARIVVKSQKIGYTQMALLEDAHIVLSPRAWGREIIIAAQSQIKADEHLKNLKDLFRRSPFRHLLVERRPKTREGRIWRDALSRSNVAAFLNPADPDGRPTRVWAVGITSHGQLLSNTSVEHLHLSDITVADATPTELDRSIAQARSRIIKSRGTMLIETPAGPPTGYVYDKCREACRELAGVSEEDRVEGMVGGLVPKKLPPVAPVDTEWARVRRIPWKAAVDAGVLTREALERDRDEINNPHEFSRLFDADFLAGALVAYPDAVRRHDIRSTTELLESMARLPEGIR